MKFNLTELSCKHFAVLGSGFLYFEMNKTQKNGIVCWCIIHAQEEAPSVEDAFRMVRYL